MRGGTGKPYSGAIVFSLDGQWVASGGGLGLVKLWDVETGRLLSTLDGQMAQGLEAVALSPDGHWIAAGGDDDTVRLWRLEAK
jgi:WD40 repeat protein